MLTVILVGQLKENKVEDYQKRVVKEQEELQHKINKLQMFLDVHPLTHTQITLYEQLVHMRGYNAILLRRIEEFEENQKLTC